MRFVFPVVLLLAVSACAPTLPPGDMMPMTQVYSQIPVNEELQRNIKLGDVGVAENVGGMTAPVTAEAYREALQNALLTSNMSIRGTDTEKYRLNARLLELDVPIMGFSMTAKSKAAYTLTRSADGIVVYNETIVLPYTAKFSEALDGAQRARLATAKAIRENITHMIRVLSSKTKEELADKGNPQ